MKGGEGSVDYEALYISGEGVANIKTGIRWSNALLINEGVRGSLNSYYSVWGKLLVLGGMRFR